MQGYSRWSKGEVDMVGINRKDLQPQWALEIMWSDRYVTKTNELKSIIKFCKENNTSNLFLKNSVFCRH